MKHEHNFPHRCEFVSRSDNGGGGKLSQIATSICSDLSRQLAKKGFVFRSRGLVENLAWTFKPVRTVALPHKEWYDAHELSTKRPARAFSIRELLRRLHASHAAGTAHLQQFVAQIGGVLFVLQVVGVDVVPETKGQIEHFYTAFRFEPVQNNFLRFCIPTLLLSVSKSVDRAVCYLWCK